MTNPALDLSIVIPAFNEAKRLDTALTRIREHFASPQHGSVSGSPGAAPQNASVGASPGARPRSTALLEIIVIDDGSSDGTARVAREHAQTISSLRVLSNKRNRGKGYSVRRGMLEARGRIVLFTDADLSSPIDESGRLLAAIADGNDVAIGSRAIDRSLIEVHQSRFREVAGIIFNRFVRLITGLPIEDTQCGFKAFRMPECRVIFEQQRIAGFGFDPEILFLAKRHGLRVSEVPVRWSHDPATKIHMIHDSARMLRDLFRVRWNWALGRYPRRRAAVGGSVSETPGSMPRRKSVLGTPDEINPKR